MRLSIFAVVAAVAQADFASDAELLASHARSLSGIVQPWNRQRGLIGALNIQREYAAVSQAVGQLQSSSQHYVANNGNAQAVIDLGAAVGSLLDTLGSKAGDFQAVGARQIAANDISDILVPTEQIISNVYKNVMHDCAHLNSLSRPLSQIELAFNNAATALGAQGPHFGAIKCVQ